MKINRDSYVKELFRMILFIYYIVDIESFWTEGYAGQIPNGGLELAIYVL